MSKRPRNAEDDGSIADRLVKRRRQATWEFAILPEHFPLLCSFLSVRDVRTVIATQRAWLAAISAQAVALIVMHPAFPLDAHAAILAWLAKRDAAGRIYGQPWYYYLEHWAWHTARPVDLPALRSLLRLPWPYALDLAERWLADPTSARSQLEFIAPWRRFPLFWSAASRFAERCHACIAHADLDRAPTRQEALAWLHITSLVVSGDPYFLLADKAVFKRKVFGNARYLAEGFGTAAILRMFDLSVVDFFEEALERPLTNADMELLRPLATLCGETLPPRGVAYLDAGETAMDDLICFAGNVGSVVGTTSDSDIAKWRELIGRVLVQDRVRQEAAGFYRPVGLRTLLHSE